MEDVMSMNSNGGAAYAVSEINVTPLIDVLLVLLIIFMVIVPVAPKGLSALIPQPARDNPVQSPSAPIVVEVRSSSVGETIYSINQMELAKADLEPRLAEIFRVRQQKVMFVQADAGLEFSKVAEVVDMGHRADVENIGLITPRTAAEK
jgi:biopolymer transport protein TolR